MRKALGIIIGMHVLAIGLSAKAESPQQEAGPGGTALVGTGIALAGGGATLSLINLENMVRVYQRNAVKAFDSQDLRGTRLGSGDIGRVAGEVRTGDEVRITYRTSDAEERKIRIAQLEKRRGEINGELRRLRTRLLDLRRQDAVTQLNGISMQIRDNMLILTDLDDQVRDLRSGKTAIDLRSATRVVDMQHHSVRELEMFLMEKSRAGKNVLTIERVPRAARMEMAQMKRAMRGNIVVAVLGGALIVEEIASGVLGDGLDSLIDSTVYVPVLQDAASAEQAQ